MSEVIVTKQNFASMLNLGKISSDAMTAFNNEISAYSKEITEMIIREQQNAQAMELMQASSEVIGVGTDIGKVLTNKTINEGLTQDISFKYSDNEKAIENKEKVGKFWEGKIEGARTDIDSADVLRNKIQKIVKENEQILRAEKVFTDVEFNKIFSDGKKGVPKFLDLGLGAGTAADLEIDVNILDKISSCMLKNKKKYIFRDFLILDENGEALNPKLINKATGKFILNFGLQGDIAEENTEAIKTITAVANYRDRVKKFSKLRGHGNLLKLLKRGTGLDEIKKEFNEYLQPIRQAKSVKKAVGKVVGVGESAVKTGYKIVKNRDIKKSEISFKRAEASYEEISEKVLEKAKKSEIQKKNLSKRRKAIEKRKEKFNREKNLLLNKKAKYEAFEKKVSEIRHPFKSFKSKIAERLKNTRIAKRISNSRLFKGLKGFRSGINSVVSIPFKIVGKVVAPIVLIVKQIIVTTVLIMLPVIILMILFMIIAGAIGGSLETTGAAGVIPLGNTYDYENWQHKYDTLDDNFLNSLEDYLANYATQRNLKGEKILYGINGQNNEEGMENEDFVNGMYYRYLTDEKNAGRSSNIEDLICMMAIIMSQSQSDYPDVAEKVLEWLYDISHKYTFVESPLYACDSGCHKIHYECNDHFHEYTDTDIRYSPFHAYRKTGGEYEIEMAENFCIVCEQRYKDEVLNTNCVVENLSEPSEEDYWGCISHQDCYHGQDGNMGRSYMNPYRCDNYEAIYICPGHETENGTHYCSRPLGCEGYYLCKGHPHYSCDGHDYKCCMGHTDIQMNVEILFYDDLKDIINKYDFGANDYIAKKLNNK